jgi:hypothetical protein
MAADRHDAVTDSACGVIDGEIRATLAVDPSPEFVARVRTRIASEPPRATSSLSWKFVAAGALAATIAIVVVSWPESKPTPVAQSPGAEDVQLAPPVAIEQPGHAPAAFPVVSGPSTRSGPSRAASRDGLGRTRATAIRPEPEILLDPAETRALRRLITGTRAGTLDLSASLQATAPAAMDLPPLIEITIPLITIDPITSQAGEEGARQ